ncbi:nitrate ABC transporter permease [Betaproteobacteria bacterium SCN1]|jgi:nitrate/nitrite transport system permease protein|nr:nitrate ABC transporter permease [Betaproteobacteria bacterium SCN1]MBN8760184.1 nitrate ABC transporter permease [Thiobacillus sp.]ODU87812.1 MAG: nitrate ABC transporter, permease protein [Thiobacillus sp. SCN 65-179]OJW39473.1 MAG: nitrate ABC transporter, permease protein [Thiobacillus sp. 65-69]
MHAQALPLDGPVVEAAANAAVASQPPAIAPAVPPGGEPAAHRRPPNRERNRRIALTLLLPLLTFLAVLAGWSALQKTVAPELPTPAATWTHATSVLADPFYENGPNDMGIGWQLLYSLGRVGAGFGLAALVGIPLGFLMGMSVNVQRAFSPLIQILRPVSPLAWLPIGLLVFKAVDPSAIFVIFITCIWPMILNTAAGVKAIPQDYMNVAAVLKLGKFELARRILFPATLPYVVTGMRLSLGVAWMVIVAAEMLTGGIGIGFWVWDEWNNLNVPSIILAIAIIGLVGIALDLVMGLAQSRLDYTKR